MVREKRRAIPSARTNNPRARGASAAAGATYVYLSCSAFFFAWSSASLSKKKWNGASFLASEAKKPLPAASRRYNLRSTPSLTRKRPGRRIAGPPSSLDCSSTTLLVASHSATVELMSAATFFISARASSTSARPSAPPLLAGSSRGACLRIVSRSMTYLPTRWTGVIMSEARLAPSHASVSARKLRSPTRFSASPSSARTSS
jgi:hypothetical protein